MVTMRGHQDGRGGHQLQLGGWVNRDHARNTLDYTLGHAGHSRYAGCEYLKFPHLLLSDSIITVWDQIFPDLRQSKRKPCVRFCRGSVRSDFNVQFFLNKIQSVSMVKNKKVLQIQIVVFFLLKENKKEMQLLIRCHLSLIKSALKLCLINDKRDFLGLLAKRFFQLWFKHI